MSDRHTFRADWHAYNDGVFFVTICSKGKQHFFGKITNGKINYSTIGNIINKCLLAIPHHHNDVELWSHIVMPNHIHMVLSISAAPATTTPTVGAQYFAPAPTHHNQIRTTTPTPAHTTKFAPTHTSQQPPRLCGRKILRPYCIHPSQPKPGKSTQNTKNGEPAELHGRLLACFYV